MSEPTLKVERKDQPDGTGHVGGGVVALAPVVDEDYWEYRVIVGEHQAVVGFSKFGTIGVGFAVEDDDNWNTNLPYTCPTQQIWEHIKDNKGDDRIPDELCVQAIRLVQEAAVADRGGVIRDA